MKKKIFTALLAFSPFLCFAQYINNSNFGSTKVSADVTTTVSPTGGAMSFMSSPQVANSNSTGLSGGLLMSGSLSSIENLSKPNFKLPIGLLVQYKGLSTVLMYNIQAASSSDSASMVKTLLLPELNSRAFLLAIHQNLYGSKEHNILTQFVFNSSVGVVKDYLGHAISPVNISFGLKFVATWDVSQSSNTNLQNLKHVSGSFRPYYSIISVSNNDYTGYNEIFNPQNKYYLQPTIQGVGSEFQLELGNFCLAFDGKYILGSGSNASNNYFSGFYWTISSKVALSLIKLNKS